MLIYRFRGYHEQIRRGLVRTLRREMSSVAAGTSQPPVSTESTMAIGPADDSSIDVCINHTLFGHSLVLCELYFLLYLWGGLTRSAEASAYPPSCSHHLLPPPQASELLKRLRALSKFPCIPNRTRSVSPSDLVISVSIKPVKF